jgi:hypothetical protein
MNNDTFFTGSFELLAGTVIAHGLILMLSCAGQQKFKHGLARR